MGFKDWLKRKRCKHVWCLVWKRDYDVHVLEKDPCPYRALNGSSTIYVCNKCGSTKLGPFIPTEEERWADQNMISHFDEVEGDG